MHAVVRREELWDPRNSILYWVDIAADCLFSCDTWNGNVQCFDVGLPVGAIGFREAGGLVLATRDRFVLRVDGKIEFLHDHEPDRPKARFNEGAVSPEGVIGNASGVILCADTNPVVH